jgi:hypothetical protein
MNTSKETIDSYRITESECKKALYICQTTRCSVEDAVIATLSYFDGGYSAGIIAVLLDMKQSEVEQKIRRIRSRFDEQQTLDGETLGDVLRRDLDTGD